MTTPYTPAESAHLSPATRDMFRRAIDLLQNSMFQFCETGDRAQAVAAELREFLATTAQPIADVSAPTDGLPLMRAAFRTEHSGSEGYWMKFKFRDLDELQQASKEWRAARAAAPLSGPSDAVSASGAGVPDGWQLAPKEPTQEMIENTAAFDLEGEDDANNAYRIIYCAMLAAAPTPDRATKAEAAPRNAGVDSLIERLELAPDAVTKHREIARELRALAATEAHADPMDWPLPCDVTVGAGTIKRVCKLSVLVARMNVMNNMIKEGWASARAADAPDLGVRDAAVTMWNSTGEQLQKADDTLRSLSSYVGQGFCADTENLDYDEMEARIKEGIDGLLKSQPAAAVAGEAVTDAERLAFLHSTNGDADGWEWGVARVRRAADGRIEYLWGLSDHSDVDAAILAKSKGSA